MKRHQRKFSVTLHMARSPLDKYFINNELVSRLFRSKPNLLIQCTRLIIVLSCAALAGCATNEFAKFYQPVNLPPNASNLLLPYSGTTELVTVSDPDIDIKRLARRGYAVIGESHFNMNGGPNENALSEQGKKVGADIVLYGSQYVGAFQGAIPFVQYNPGTTSTTTSSGTVNANVYGNRGSAYGTANYSGTSTTTTPGNINTQMIPVTVHRFDYHAVFWRKLKHAAFGVTVRPLSDQLRTRLQRNTGAEVAIVREESPAFLANILEGDVITKFAGEDVASPNDFIEKTREKAGQRVDVEIWRDGQTKIIAVQTRAL